MTMRVTIKNEDTMANRYLAVHVLDHSSKSSIISTAEVRRIAAQESAEFHIYSSRYLEVHEVAQELPRASGQQP